MLFLLTAISSNIWFPYIYCSRSRYLFKYMSLFAKGPTLLCRSFYLLSSLFHNVLVTLLLGACLFPITYLYGGQVRLLKKSYPFGSVHFVFLLLPFSSRVQARLCFLRSPFYFLSHILLTDKHFVTDLWL